MTLGILASGRGSNMEAILDAIDAGRLPLKAGVVISNRPAARALAAAEERGVPAFFIDPKPFGSDRAAYDRQIVQVLQAHGVDLVALAGYMRLVTPTFLEAFPGRVLNVHPSLLPAFPGLNAQAQALEYGVKVSGCTVFIVDDGVDTGPIVLQAAVPVADDDTELTLAARILEEEHRIFPAALAMVAAGQIRVDGRRVTRLA